MIEISPNSLATTVVFDVGARYGMHPSWRDFGGEMHYVAFEPDAEEAQRLRQTTRRTGFEVIEAALDKKEGTRDFYLLKHRGLSSFLKPDLTSECFRHLKPGQAEIEKVIQIPTRSLDSVASERAVQPDFLKVDTEGTEQDVVEGAEQLLKTCVLGIRSSCNFQACFVGQRLFSEQHDYLVRRDFILLNLDYRGFGYPRLGLFRKPDPIEMEDFRYGVLVAADAVWIRKPSWLETVHGKRSELAGQTAACKLAYFCMLNHAPDVGIDLLREHLSRQQGVLASGLSDTRLFRSLQLHIAEFLGRWRTVPDEQWERCRGIYRSIYGEDLQGGSGFYPQVQAMRERLASV